jgi:hypothetical protein
MVAMKVFVRHPAIGEAVFLLGEESTVTLGRRGRTAACEFGWDPRISDRHAQMWLEDGTVWFEDLGSKHGSYLGDRRVEGRIALERGDQVRIGDTWLYVPDELEEWAEINHPLWTPTATQDLEPSEWVEDRPRRHRRYVTRQRILVRLDGEAEPRVATMRDISKGGMFLEARQPPPLGTLLELQIERANGLLRLTGEVVHVVDANRSRAYTIPTGIGVRLKGIAGAVEREWMRYLESLGASERSAKPISVPSVAWTPPAPEPEPEVAQPTSWWHVLAYLFVPAWERVEL